MPQKCGGHIFRLNSGAIVLNLNQAETCILNAHINLSGTRINTIFNQFLDHRCRTFNHFTGSDLVAQINRKLMNFLP